MHPYRGGRPVQTVDDDEEVRCYARRVRREQRVSVALAFAGALVLSVGVFDWPLAAFVLSGKFLGSW